MKFSHMHMNHFCPSDIQQVTITRNYTNSLTEIKVSVGMNLFLLTHLRLFSWVKSVFKMYHTSVVDI